MLTRNLKLSSDSQNQPMNITVHNTEKVPIKSLHNTLPNANLVVAQMQVIPWAEKLLTPIFGVGSVTGLGLGGIIILGASGIATVYISSKQMEKLQKENEQREYLMRAVKLAGLAITKMDHLTKKQAQTQKKDLFDVKIYDKNRGISDYKIVFMVKK